MVILKAQTTIFKALDSNFETKKITKIGQSEVNA
jgi:hypothetical protein